MIESVNQSSVYNVIESVNQSSVYNMIESVNQSSLFIRPEWGRALSSDSITDNSLD